MGEEFNLRRGTKIHIIFINRETTKMQNFAGTKAEIKPLIFAGTEVRTTMSCDHHSQEFRHNLIRLKFVSVLDSLADINMLC